MLKAFVSLMSIGILALGPVTQSAVAATPVAKPVVPSSVPPPDPGDTYAGVWGISHTCNANNLCQGTFSGTAQLAGWAKATLHVYVSLYANGTKLASNSHICYASTSCSVSDGPVSFNYIFGQAPQVCATASGQAQYSSGPAVGDDQECVYIGSGGTAIASQ